jgi:hypothetical protein
LLPDVRKKKVKRQNAKVKPGTPPMPGAIFGARAAAQNCLSHFAF